jgi:hypothetical protein
MEKSVELMLKFSLEFYKRWWRGKDYSAQAPRPSGRYLRQRFLAALESNLGRRFSSFPVWRKMGIDAEV